MMSSGDDQQRRAVTTSSGDGAAANGDGAAANGDGQRRRSAVMGGTKKREQRWRDVFDVNKRGREVFE